MVLPAASLVWTPYQTLKSARRALRSRAWVKFVLPWWKAEQFENWCQQNLTPKAEDLAIKRVETLFAVQIHHKFYGNRAITSVIPAILPYSGSISPSQRISKGKTQKLKTGVLGGHNKWGRSGKQMGTQKEGRNRHIESAPNRFTLFSASLRFRVLHRKSQRISRFILLTRETCMKFCSWLLAPMMQWPNGSRPDSWGFLRWNCSSLHPVPSTLNQSLFQKPKLHFEFSPLWGCVCSVFIPCIFCFCHSLLQVVLDSLLLWQMFRPPIPKSSVFGNKEGLRPST